MREIAIHEDRKTENASQINKMIYRGCLCGFTFRIQETESTQSLNFMNDVILKSSKDYY